MGNNKSPGGWVYIITNIHNQVLYTGVTSDLIGRIYEHKQKLFSKSFSARYNLNKLVYYRFFYSIQEAINEEKRIKSGNRKQKIRLIFESNPEWRDLYDDMF